MRTETIVSIFGIVITATIAFAGYLAANRANRATATAASVAVDAGAYSRAKEIYDGAIGTLQEHGKELEDSVAELRAEVLQLRAQSAELSAEVERRFRAGES